MYNRHRVLYSVLLFCIALTFFSFRPGGDKEGKKKWIIVIDPGHGGKDPGCHGRHFKEKDIALAVSLKFGHLIEENNKDVTVIYTRKTDEFIALNERAEIANRNHADLFVCIHCNASPDHDASGAATYVMGLNKSEGNIEIAKRENSSILYEKDYKQTYGGFDPNSDEAAVLFAMYQNLYLEQSVDLSTHIQHQYESLVKTTDNGVKQAGFLVLWKTAMPSLLTEIGFLTNVDEEKVLGSQKGQDQIAKSIFLAFEQYKAEKDGTTFSKDDFNFNQLMLKNTGDTVTTDSVENHIAKVDDTTQEKTVNVDTTSKVVTPIVHKEPVKKPIVVKNDSNELRVKKMQEAINSKPKDTAAEVPKKIVQEVKHKDTVATTVKQVKPVPPPVAVTTDDSLKIIYKVQFLVSAHPVSIQDSKYAVIPDMAMYLDNTIYKYTAGHFDNVKDAIDLQLKLRNTGYKDAFVVTFRGNKRVILPKVSSK